MTEIQIRDAIGVAIGSAFVENWVVVATGTAADGEQAIHLISDCAHAWQVLGLLAHAAETTKHSKYHSDHE